MIKVIFKCNNCENETGKLANPSPHYGSTVSVICDKCGKRERIQRKVTKKRNSQLEELL